MGIYVASLTRLRLGPAALLLLAAPPAALAQLSDQTQTPNRERAGIFKSLAQEVGAGRGTVTIPDSSLYIIKRDPFRAIRRGRQLFQRKFTRTQGGGPRNGDGGGNTEEDQSVNAGLGDSCAACHGRPRGGAGSGGDVFTRPDSRDAPHLFGLGLIEMLGDEMTTELRATRDLAVLRASARGQAVTLPLRAKGISFGLIRATPDGFIDTSQVQGVDRDLRVRPFFAHGGEFSMRAFLVGAFRNEMGLQAYDPDLDIASHGGRVVTPSGLVLDGSMDTIMSSPTPSPYADPDGDGVVDEVPVSLIDHFEFYLLNYFKPGSYAPDKAMGRDGRKVFDKIGCATCHVPDLVVDRDRRVADVETVYDATRGIFNNLFSTASLRLVTVDDHSGLPTMKLPAGEAFVVENVFTDLKRHDLGPDFHERNFDGSLQTQFVTEPLWGVASTAPYGHDGRSVNLEEVILRHGGEARAARDTFAKLGRGERAKLLEFLGTLIIFPPDDTASNLDPGDRRNPTFPQRGHGSISVTVLFNDPSDPE